MADERNIVVARDKARRYGGLSADYAEWVPSVKALVNEAGDDDWGTFVVACALLEDVIPQNEKDAVERQIEVDRRETTFRERMRRRGHGRRTSCVFLAGAAAAAVFACFYETILTYDPFVAGVGFVFESLSMALFAALGGVSAGFALGARSEWARDNGAFAAFLSCLAGVACAFVCPLFPPVALVLIWAAWHSSDFVKPRVTTALETQVVHRGTHGQRAFAKDPRAPEFVKNAMRLAGVYQASPGEVGQLARETLRRRQSDYGAFVVYDALLSEHHAACQAKALVGADDGEAGGDGRGVAERRRRDAEREWDDRKVIVRWGVASSIVVAAVLWKSIGFELALADFAALFGLARYHVSMGIVVVGIAVPVFVGWRSAVRAAAIHGIDRSGRCLIGVARSAWFSAWVTLAGVYVAYLLSALSLLLPGS